MKTSLKVGLVVLASILGQAALAEEAAAPAADAPVVAVSVTGEQVVTVNSGNETVDAAANYAVKCAEKTAAMKTCEGMGSFKAIACKKMAEMRYKGVECPIQ